MDILRIAALGTAGVLLGITVKGAKPEFALLVTVGAGLCILFSFYDPFVFFCSGHNCDLFHYNLF